MRCKLTLLVAILAVAWQTTVAMAAEPVFRGLRWGDPLEALGEWQVVEENGPIVKVRRVNEDLALGNVRASIIEYHFFENRFFRVMVATDDARELEDLMRARYGRPMASTALLSLWYLPDQDTMALFGTEQGIGVMSLTSESISHEALEWEKAQKAAEAQAAW